MNTSNHETKSEPLPTTDHKALSDNKLHPLAYLAWKLDNPLRVSISLMLGFLCLIISFNFLDWKKALLSSWIIGISCYLLFIALVAVDADSQATRRRTRREPHAMSILVTIVIIALLSNISFGFLLNSIYQAPHHHDYVLIILCGGAIWVSWMLLHTSFGRYYCQVYYASKDHLGQPAAGGVRGGFTFHNTPEPTQLDFFYLAFMIGLTYSSSDVNVTNHHTRKLILLHALISFMFYTIVVTSILNVAVFS